MVWFRVDDGFADHPKVLGVSPAALGLWVRAGAWCAKHLTDGRVPRSAVSILGGSTKTANELASAGLWITTPDGYEFHQWTEHQPSRADVLADRDDARRRKQESRDRHRESQRSHSVTPRVTNGERTASVTAPTRARIPDPTRPDPTKPDPNHTQTNTPAREAERFNSNDLERLFSDARKAAGKGAATIQRSDYDRAQKAVEWAKRERPHDPAGACSDGIANYLAGATGLAVDAGHPFWGWANDPGAWLLWTPARAIAAKPTRAPAPVASAADFQADIDAGLYGPQGVK